MLQKDRHVLYEQFVFGLMILLHLLPVVCFKLSPTLDGPSHLYNSNIINDLVLSGGNTFGTFFSLNSNIEPNWLGHAVFGLFNYWMPAFIAEKAVFLLYFILLPVSFRFLLHTLREDRQQWGSYLVFPFIYSFTLLMGFINFCLSLPLLFFILGYWQRHQQHMTLKQKGMLTLLLVLTYFAHLMIFLLAGGIMLFMSIEKKPLRIFAGNMLNLLTVSLPGLILSTVFLIGKSGSPGNITHSLSFSVLGQWIIMASPLITFTAETEMDITSWIFYLFAFLSGWGIIRRIGELIREKSIKKDDRWLLLALLILSLYFTIPDKLFTGGFISSRLLLLFYLFLALWLGMQQHLRLVRTVSLAVVLSVSLYLTGYHIGEIASLNKVAAEYYSLAGRIPENSVVLPLSYSNNWLHSNYSNYTGSDKKIIVLDNYEAATPHFPTRWNEKMKPYDLIGNYAESNRPCVTIRRYTDSTGIPVDFVIRWMHNPAMNDSCTLSVNQQLAEEYDLVYKAAALPMELYRLKK